MIKIDFNIIFDDISKDDIPIEYNDVIYGNVLLKINNSIYKHNDTVLCSWMYNFIRTISNLKCSLEYSIKEPENYWDFIKFERKKSEISVTYLNNNNVVWIEKVEYSDFKAEVIRAAKEFRTQLCNFDFRFSDSKVVLTINNLLDQITM